MKSKYFLPALIIIILFVGSISIVFAYTPIGGPTSITGRGTVPFLGPKALLDDFNQGLILNAWNCVTGTFSKSSATPPPANEICTASYSTDTPTGAGYSLKLDYRVSALNTYAGYYSQLGGGSLVLPTAYTAISFWVKGAVGGEFFKVQLKNTSTTSYTFVDGSDTYYYDRNEAAVYITDYLDGGVTTGWKKVTIPLHNFANLDGFNSMKEFVIVFENSQCTANGSLAYGTIYIDDITFENTTVSAVRVDHFGDKLGVCALGGNMGSGVGDGAPASLNKYSFSGVTNEFSPYANGLKLEYNVTSGYAYTFLIFGGASNAKTTVAPIKDKSGWIAIPHSFSAYNLLHIVVRGSTGGNPKEMRIELTDSSSTKVVRISGITTNFQYWDLPLGAFQVPDTGAILNKATIKQLTIVFEGDRIGTAGGNKSGVVYVDSLEFRQ